jgi:tetratricopeptide (TPR) repeat protein
MAATAASVVFATLTLGVVLTIREAGFARRQSALAEERAAEAERARRGMEDERNRAERERGRAEEQSVRAGLQRQLAEKRYDQVRSLATTILFDVHDSIRNLPGAEAARRLAVQKGVEYLGALEKDSGGDPKLQSELAAAYERSGDLDGNLFDRGLDGGRAALPVFIKALALRRKVVAEAPDRADAKLALARCYVKVGDGQLSAAKQNDAIAAYRSAIQVSESVEVSVRSHAEWRTLQGLALTRLCGTTLYSGGNARRAMEICNDAVRTLEAIRSPDKEVTGLLVTAHAQRANTFRYGGAAREALPDFHKALDLNEGLMRENPEDGRPGKTEATILMYLAAALDSLNDSTAGDAYTNAIVQLEISHSAFPTDYGLTATFALALKKYSLFLRKSGRETEGEAAFARAIHLLREMAEKPKAGAVELNDLAYALVRSPYAGLVDSKQGLEFASRANLLSGGRNPGILDTLAWAYYQSGQVEKAVDTARSALALMPSPGKNPSSGLRGEIESGLAEFEHSQRAAR